MLLVEEYEFLMKHYDELNTILLKEKTTEAHVYINMPASIAFYLDFQEENRFHKDAYKRIRMEKKLSDVLLKYHFGCRIYVCTITFSNNEKLTLPNGTTVFDLNALKKKKTEIENTEKNSGKTESPPSAEIEPVTKLKEEEVPDIFKVLEQIAAQFISQEQIKELNALHNLAILSIFQQYQENSENGVTREYFTERLTAFIAFTKEAIPKNVKLSPLQIRAIFSPEGLQAQKQGLNFANAFACKSADDLSKLIKKNYSAKTLVNSQTSQQPQSASSTATLMPASITQTSQANQPTEVKEETYDDEENYDDEIDFFKEAAQTAAQFISTEQIEELNTLTVFCIFSQYAGKKESDLPVTVAYFVERITAFLAFRKENSSKTLTAYLNEMFSPKGLLAQKKGLDFKTAAACQSGRALLDLIKKTNQDENTSKNIAVFS